MSPASPALEKAPLWIGLMKADGMLIPLGRYEAGTWHLASPSLEMSEETRKRLRIPVFPEDQRRSAYPSRWFLSTSGARDYPVKSGKVIEYDDEFFKAPALETDYPDVQQERNYIPHRPIGAAANKASVLVRMIDLSVSDSTVAQIMAVVKSKWEASEDRIITGENRIYDDRVLHSGHPIAQQPRAQTPFSTFKVKKGESLVGGKGFYQVSAVKKYPRPRDMSDSDCEGLTYFRSLLHKTNDSLAMLSHSVSLTDCDGKGSYVEADPFSLIDVDGRAFLITEELGYEDHDFLIYEIRDDGLRCVMAFYRGRC
jgi:hypothetical protein